MLLLYAAYVFYIVVLVGTCSFALLKGGRSEQQATISLIAGVVATQVAYLMGPDWKAPDYGIMAVDAALLVAFTVIARRSERFWPIWIAAAQMAGLITHFAVVIHPDEVTKLYQFTQPFWVFPILAGIGWGTWTGQRETSSS